MKKSLLGLKEKKYVSYDEFRKMNRKEWADLSVDGAKSNRKETHKELKK